MYADGQLIYSPTQNPEGVKSDLKSKCMQFVTARLYRRQGNLERQCEDNVSSN